MTADGEAGLALGTRAPELVAERLADGLVSLQILLLLAIVNLQIGACQNYLAEIHKKALGFCNWNIIMRRAT